MDIQAISIFPEMFMAITHHGVTQRALEKGLWSFDCVNPRKHSGNRLGYIDDKPYGGGPGMTMRVEPLMGALDEAKSKARGKTLVVAPTPQGRQISQELVTELASYDSLIFVCGRYEGMDERFYEAAKPMEISVGDMVVSGGELPAMMIMDAVLRLVPGVLGDENSAMMDTFSDGLLEGPQYTHPSEWNGMAVPEILMSGHHANISMWRKKQAILRTWERRRDLFYRHVFNPEEAKLLKELFNEGLIPEEALKRLKGMGKTPANFRF